MPDDLPKLCGEEGCRRIAGHQGSHDKTPTEAWSFLNDKDQDKLTKAGFATPRGGAKGGYQNHVLRSGTVIIPFERLDSVPIKSYQDGWVVRLYPEQFFDKAGVPKANFGEIDKRLGARIEPGVNAFVLYRNRASLEKFPPLKGWQTRALVKNGAASKTRGTGVTDTGHYILRLSPEGKNKKEFTGPPQGMFAPEYADQETNFLCKCVLVWLTVHTDHSPYTTKQAVHLKAILQSAGLLDDDVYESKGVFRHGLTCCPLCLRILDYPELHKMLSFEEGFGYDNAPGQVEGATRSTIVNLFHLIPLTYQSINHLPQNVGWGHAICNTRLGQRACRSLSDLQANGQKVGIITEKGVETFGWIDNDWEMIRSGEGSVWIRISRDYGEAVPADAEADILSTDVVHAPELVAPEPDEDDESEQPNE